MKHAHVLQHELALLTPENKIRGISVDTCAHHKAASVCPWPSPDGPRSNPNPAHESPTYLHLAMRNVRCAL